MTPACSLALMRRSRSLWLTAFFLAGAGSVFASTAPKTQPKQMSLPPLLKEVEAKYARAATVTANFSELDESGALKQKKKSSGNLEFKKPGKIRWETQSPDKNLLVSDGKKYWFYTPRLIPRKPANIGKRKPPRFNRN